MFAERLSEATFYGNFIKLVLNPKSTIIPSISIFDAFSIATTS